MTSVSQALRLLLVEDDPGDAKLILRELTMGGFVITHTRVMNAQEMSQALAQGGWDVILCDYSLPQFSGETALRMVREIGCDAPVIFVSGAMGEETAVNAMRLGAQDYVMKDNLARLAPAVQRELREATIRREARQADLNMRQSEHKYRHLFESLSDAAFLFAEANGVIIDTNVAAERLLGSNRHDIVGLRFGDRLSPPLPLEQLRAPSSAHPEFETEIQRHDGSHVAVRVNLSDVELHDRRFVLALVHDTTAQRAALEALQASEERFSQIFNLSPTGICVIRVSTGEFVDVNDAFLRIMGYDRKELLGRSSRDLNLWSNPDERVATIAALRENKTLGVHRLNGRRRNGEPFVALAASTVMNLNGESHYLSLLHDITDLHQAEEARRESEQRFRQVTDNIGEVFWLTDARKAEFIYVSPAYRTIWGRSCEELYASPLCWLDSVHEADRERVHASVPGQAQGTYDLEYRIQRPDGTIRWIHDRAFPIANDKGEVYRIAGIAEDITERRQLEEQFRQAQKMEAIGQLAGGIAHDFNNLLTIVTMQCSMLASELKQNEAARAGLQQVLDAASRGVALTRQLLTFSRREMEEEARAIDIAHQLGAMTKLLRRILGEQIEVETRLPRGLPMVLVDPGKMEQVLMNLVVNARDAMPNGGKLGVYIDAVDIDAEYVAAKPAARVGKFVKLTVTDTGSGIPPEILPRIFEPFFTTKEIGKGTGLGLATVFGIVQQHQGWLEVDSAVGTGTKFEVFIPALKEPAMLKAEETVATPTTGGHESVLVVEDEDVVRDLAVEALTREGYRVRHARSGAEALREWHACNGEIDLMVTDLVMPGGMSGQALAAELRANNPELKVIYSTGYSGEIVGKLSIRSGWDYLPKPYSIHDLTAIVRRRLDDSKAPVSHSVFAPVK